ncbi:methyltransferase domain-containing protein [Planctomycetota bacterium]|nr:methyltransferase domain-containing protein [Planctomycetota bacterium]
MKQNIYDNSTFFKNYIDLRNEQDNLNDLIEQPVMQALLPSLQSKHILDLGCGYANFENFALPQDPTHITAVDISANMIEKATKNIQDPRVTFVHQPIEDFIYTGPKFDLVYSSLALHYIRDFEALAQRVYEELKPGGQFIFSVEHPILTCLKSEWIGDPESADSHWPVDHYFEEGLRQIHWFVDDVHKYHRTIENYISTLLGAGFDMKHFIEPRPSEEIVERMPRHAQHRRRPIYIILDVQKPRKSV